MAKTPDVRGMSQSQMGVAPSQVREKVTSMFAPTERPDEPITSGIAMGPGPGPEVLGVNQMQPQTEDDIRFRAAIKDYMPVLAYVASLPNTSPETRKVIRQLRDNL